jgi:hypothetical protein
MFRAHGQKSEVARLLREITERQEAAQQGLTGLRFGAAQHAFINTQLQQAHAHLRQMVGDEQAIALIAQTLEQSL